MKQIQFSIDLAREFFNASEDFVVDLDDAWGWLGYAEKRNAVRKLTHHYKENTDYTFARSGERDVPLSFGVSSANIAGQYMLTVDCFKGLAMMAETDQGDAVRAYFMQCEKEAKAAAAKIPLLEAELTRLRELMEQPQTIVSQIAPRPLPAAVIRGYRCEAEAVWKARSKYDPIGALAAVKAIDHLADTYIKELIAGGSNPVAQTLHMKVGDAAVYEVPLLPFADRIGTLEQYTWSNGKVQTHRRTTVALHAAVKLALQALPSDANYIDLTSLKLAILSGDALAAAQKSGNRLGTAISRALLAAGWKRHKQRPYDARDRATYGYTERKITLVYKRISSGGAA
jgi:phage anti-repressor protein